MERTESNAQGNAKNDTKSLRAFVEFASNKRVPRQRKCFRKQATLFLSVATISNTAIATATPPSTPTTVSANDMQMCEKPKDNYVESMGVWKLLRVPWTFDW